MLPDRKIRHVGRDQTDPFNKSLTGIFRRPLYNWRLGGIVPYFKMGKAVRFRVADVVAAIERMRIG